MAQTPPEADYQRLPPRLRKKSPNSKHSQRHHATLAAALPPLRPSSDANSAGTVPLSQIRTGSPAPSGSCPRSQAMTPTMLAVRTPSVAWLRLSTAGGTDRTCQDLVVAEQARRCACTSQMQLTIGCRRVHVRARNTWLTMTLSWLSLEASVTSNPT